VRDRAIVETLYSTGMRRGELSGLDLYDVDFDRGWVTIRQGKGAKDRVVPIGSRALAWIRKYLDEIRPELVLRADEPVLFLSTTGERIPATSLTLLVRRLFVAAGVTKKGSCHLFRHAMATLMLERGADIRYIQEILGHSTLETTQAYTKVSIQKLKEIHEATHPGARLARRAPGASPVPAADLLLTLDQEAEDELEGGVQTN
jgi:integrase/recombinase XerD